MTGNQASKKVRLGQFNLIRVIGKGGMGEVWKACHIHTGMPAAVKVLTAMYVRRIGYRQAFRNEVRAMARLRHPTIATIFDHGEVTAQVEKHTHGRLLATSPYIAMELARSGTLSSTWAPIGWASVRDMLLLLLDALAHAHARGVIHRDLKPSNVLMTRDSNNNFRPKLADFGVAHASDPQDDIDEDAKAGTPHYMAPEQIKGDWRDQGPWTDLYALGCMSYWLCSSDPPFRHVAKSVTDVFQAHLLRRIPRLKSIVSVPDGFQSWLDRMLAKNPTDRFQRAADAAYALALLDDSQPQKQCSEQGSTQPTNEPDRERRLALSECTTLSIKPAPIGLATLSCTHSLRIDSKQAPASSERLHLALPIVPPIPQTWRHPETRPDPIAMVGAGLSLHGLRVVPFVDRDSDRDEVWGNLVRTVESCRAHVVILRGLAGVGKSRLAEWVAQRADEVGGAVVFKAHHGPPPAPTDGLVPMLERYLGTAGLEHREILKRLLNLCERGFLGLPRTESETGGNVQVAMLANLIRPHKNTEWSSHQSWYTREERFGIIAGVLKQITQFRPVLLWLDDVHWGHDTLSFVQHLLSLQQHQPVPILIVMTVREDVLAQRTVENELIKTITECGRTEIREIGPLDATHHSHLVQQVLRLEGDLGTQVEDRTAGNPLFAVQLIGDWVQRGVLDVGQTGFRLKKNERVPLPDDIHQLWSDRIERLAESFENVQSDDVKQALEIAALFGEKFISSEWDTACRYAEINMPPGFTDVLANQRLARVETDGIALEHGMLRESLERSCQESQRSRHFHLAIATMIEETYAQGQIGRAERLSHHYLKSNRLEDATTELVTAAREQWAMGEYEQCRELLARCRTVLSELGVRQRDSRWTSCFWIEASTFTSQFRTDDAEPVVKEFAKWAAATGDEPNQAQALVLQGHIQIQRGQFADSIKSYEKATTFFKDERDTFWYGSALRNRAAALCFLGDHVGALRAFDASLEFARKNNDTRNIAWTLQGLGNVFSQTGDQTRGTEVLTEAKHLFEQLGAPKGLAWTLNGLGELARSSGQLVMAEEYYEKAFALMSATISKDQAVVQINLALVLIEREHFNHAKAILQKVIHETEGRQYYLTGVAWVCLLPCLAHRGEWEQWDESLAKGINGIEKTDLIHSDLAANFQRAGQIALGCGETKRAREVLTLAAEQWKALGQTENLESVKTLLNSLDE